jgi:AraC-like DNA-binding protein/ligand-binding sensor protein
MERIFLNADMFDLKLATECSNAFSDSTGLGCTVLNVKGDILHEAGYGCGCCSICSLIGIDKTDCIESHAYGMSEAERFGGKYIYFCKMGLGCFVSPIAGPMTNAAKVTVGPFRMIDMDDYVSYDLKLCREMSKESIDLILPVLLQIPYVAPHKVHSLSTLLFMSVSFINNVSIANKMLEDQGSGFIQGQISDYILKLKSGEEPMCYPFQIEQELLSSIMESNKPKAQKLLNELLGNILFYLGCDFARIKTRVYELLVLLSRAAIDAGALPEYVFDLSHEFFTRAHSINNIENLCFHLVKIMNQLIDYIFHLEDVKNSDVIRKAVHYMRRNYPRKISLDEVAQVVDLSPSYFSKIFKKEMGCNFNTYMNIVRIGKSIKLLLYEDLELVNIATLVGFEDQSYFTKVFKHITGISPHSFRKNGGRIPTLSVDNQSPYISRNLMKWI